MATATDLARACNIKRGIVKDVFNQIIRMLQRGEKVKLTGFGTFARRVHAGRQFTTPAVEDGRLLSYPDSYVIRFHQSPIAKTRINMAVQAPEPTKGKVKAKSKNPKAKRAPKKQLSKKAGKR